VGYWVDVWRVKVRRSCAKSWAAWGLTFEKHISKTIQNINFVELLSVGSEKSFKVQIRYNQTRVAFLQQFPYGVHFNLIENEIIIFAVFNTSQSPKKWSIR